MPHCLILLDGQVSGHQAWLMDPGSDTMSSVHQIPIFPMFLIFNLSHADLSHICCRWASSST